MILSNAPFVPLCSHYSDNSKEAYDARKDLDSVGMESPIYEAGTIGGTSAIYEANKEKNYLDG